MDLLWQNFLDPCMKCSAGLRIPKVPSEQGLQALKYTGYRHAIRYLYMCGFTSFLSTQQIYQGRIGYEYANTHLRTHLDQKYGRLYPISEGFLITRIHNVC